jgi:hypothetical protein
MSRRAEAMGYSPFYQAIPEESELFRRLQVDPKLECVLSHLYPQGSRPLDLWETGREVEEVVGYIAEGSDLFRSREEAEQTLADLDNLIARACLDAYPGLVDRVAFIEKTLDQIEDRLRERVDPVLLAGAVEHGHWLFSSDTHFVAYELRRGYDGFGIVSPARVSAVAAILDHIEPGSIFDPETEDHLIEDLQSLKTLYQEAAKLGEAILVN